MTRTAMLYIPEMLPCPFQHSGTHNNLAVMFDYIYDRPTLQYFVVCLECDARGPAAWDEVSAVEDWNSAIRPGE